MKLHKNEKINDIAFEYLLVKSYQNNYANCCPFKQ